MDVSDTEGTSNKSRSSRVVNPDDVYNFADYDNEGKREKTYKIICIIYDTN